MLNIKPANEDQRDFIFNTSKEILFSSGAGGGKSYAGILKGLMLNIRYGGNRGLITRKEMTALRNSTWITVHEVIPEDMIVYENQVRGIIEHKTSDPARTSEIRFAGLDRKKGQDYPTKIGSTEFGWIFADEANELEIGDWEMLITRLRLNFDQYDAEFNDRIPRQIFAATNPDTPHHWIHKRFIEDEQDDRDVIFTTPYENPYLPDGYIESMESMVGGIRRERLLEGKWVQAEGMVFDYDARKHRGSEKILDDVNDYQRIVLGMDSNYPKPRAAVLIGFTGEEFHVIDEYYEQRSHPEDLAKWVNDVVLGDEHHDVKKSRVEAYHDPSDPSAIDKIQRHTGITVKKADNDVIPGIASVNRHFENNTVMIHPRCSNVVDEITAYEWKSEEEEKPVDEDDHLMDAMRYAVHTQRPTGEVSVLSGFNA
jgi:phage terminase large subunit